MKLSRKELELLIEAIDVLVHTYNSMDKHGNFIAGLALQKLPQMSQDRSVEQLTKDVITQYEDWKVEQAETMATIYQLRGKLSKATQGKNLNALFGTEIEIGD